MPNNCLNCQAHATYDATTHQVAGATFLPFDPTTFVFSARAGYTEREQAPSIASLDELIRPATTPSARELIAGWYPLGPSEPVPQDFIPAGWTSTPLERKVYEHVIAASCRNCHVSRTDELSYATAAQFTANAEAIARSVCINRDMPNADIPLQNLWSGPARAYLAATQNNQRSWFWPIS